MEIERRRNITAITKQISTNQRRVPDQTRLPRNRMLLSCYRNFYTLSYVSNTGVLICEVIFSLQTISRYPTFLIRLFIIIQRKYIFIFSNINAGF